MGQDLGVPLTLALTLTPTPTLTLTLILTPTPALFLTLALTLARFQLYASDPSGNYGGWKATSIGANSANS